MSLIDALKESLSKTTLANISSFILLMGLLYYGIKKGDKDIVMLAGGWGGGYLFGANNRSA